MPKKRACADDLRVNAVAQIVSGKMLSAQTSRHYRIKDSALYAWKAVVLETVDSLDCALPLAC
ncbi:MAG: hypothetical protein OXE95_07655 [Chloroflexi bacterium]|nr:hypothetical protein [Chloroflexota bacterium]MCY4247432.1 hypothetical protein [Chloroflexota bacterium]